MIWTPMKHYNPWAFNLESELEHAISQVSSSLFGENRVYLDVKKLIGEPGKTRNIPDGYLLDFSSPRRPVLYLVEVELAKHDPLRHIARQLLEFSLSFKSTPQKMKDILRDAIRKSPEILEKCDAYARHNNFNNTDYLLERMIYADKSFNTLLIIDRLDDELESILRTSLAFPVEILTLERHKAESGECAYTFEPFLYDISAQITTSAAEDGNEPKLDPVDIDTLVVPARKEGFDSVFLGENMWRAVRIHSSMASKIRYVAAYQVAPISAITHYAPVSRVELWQQSGKYVLYFSDAAKEIGPLKLIQGGQVSAPQGPRYTSFGKLSSANSMDDVF